MLNLPGDLSSCRHPAKRNGILFPPRADGITLTLFRKTAGTQRVSGGSTGIGRPLFGALSSLGLGRLPMAKREQDGNVISLN